METGFSEEDVQGIAAMGKDMMTQMGEDVSPEVRDMGIEALKSSAQTVFDAQVRHIRA